MKKCLKILAILLIVFIAFVAIDTSKSSVYLNFEFETQDVDYVILGNYLTLRNYPSQSSYTDEKLKKKILSFLNGLPLKKAEYGELPEQAPIAYINFHDKNKDELASVGFYGLEAFDFFSVFSGEYIVILLNNDPAQVYKAHTSWIFIMSRLRNLQFELHSYS